MRLCAGHVLIAFVGAALASLAASFAIGLHPFAEAGTSLLFPLTACGALLADIRIGAENAEFGALERRWNIVGGDGLTARLPLVVGFAHAMELIITGRRIDVHEAHRLGLVNEIVPEGKGYERALELAQSICELPQGAIRADKESVMRGVSRTVEERLRIEAETILSMFLRKDKHSAGAQAFLDKDLKPEWPHHGL